MADKRRSKQAVEEHDSFRNLMDAFSYTAEDIKSNQQGLISPKQQEKLDYMGKKLTRYSSFGIKFIAIFVLIGGGLMFWMINSTSGMSAAEMAIFLIAIPSPILIMIAYSFVTKRQRAQYENARLMLTEGMAEVTRKTRGGRYGPSTYWEIKIGDFKLNLSEEYAILFKKGTVYRAYYVHVGKVPTPLSFEETG